jgi:adenylate cyclase
VSRSLLPALGALAAAFALALAGTLWRDDGAGRAPLERLERWAVDFRFELRGPRPPARDVVIVAIDDRTAEQQAELFERRAGWAQVIAATKRAGASVIGVDALFDVPERLLGALLQTRVTTWRNAQAGAAPQQEAERLLWDIAIELGGDEQLAATIREAGNVVLIVYAGSDSTTLESTWLGRARYGQSTLGPTPPPEVRGVVGSLPDIAGAAKGLGFATSSEDVTRTVRRVRFAMSHDGAVYMPFAVPVLAVARGFNRGQLAYVGPEQAVQLGDARVSLDDDALWLDFPGPAGTFPTYSALDVVAGRLPAGALEGKLVLLGLTRRGYDEVQTPFGLAPGVEVQAALLDNLLRGQSLTRTKRATELALAFGLGLAAALLFVSRRLAVQLGGGAALLVGWSAVTIIAFTQRALWLPWVLPTASVLAGLLAGLLVAYVTEVRQRQHLRRAFSRYVGEDVLAELLAHPEKLQLGGERRELSVFFSDIRDFTTLSERLSPVDLVTFLNTYLSPMTEAVLKEGGLLDKYIGDAVMGVFGAPVPQTDHADRALRCVLAMHRELEALNAGPLQRLGLTAAIGVGVNTGDMVVGNMGSAERFDYTVAGDAVNLASRLEGLSKTYGVFCLVGEGTVRASRAGFTFRELDLVQVKGKHEAVGVYELLAGPGRVIAERRALDAWTRGLAAFRAGELPAARAALTAFGEANPDDVTVRRYLARLAELPEVAPPGFSAVTAFHTK